VAEPHEREWNESGRASWRPDATGGAAELRTDVRHALDLLTAGLRLREVAAAVDAYLPKPFELAELLACVERLLPTRPAAGGADRPG
jgi:hypothetical protein